MNISHIRSSIPGLTDEKIFLDSAGSSLVSRPTMQAMTDYFTQESVEGGYRLMEESGFGIVKDLKVALGELINCNPEQIAIAQSATDAYNKAIDSIKFESGDCIVTSELDYVSNQFTFINLKQRYGIDIIRIKSDIDGNFDEEEVGMLLENRNVKCMAITHVPTNTGTVQNIKQIGDLCSNYNTIYIVDACQSLGQMKVDVKSINCDFLSATGRKFMRGPRGTGFLYVSERMLNQDTYPHSIDAWSADWITSDVFKPKSDATRFENFEKSYGVLAGFKNAVEEINLLGIEHIESRNIKLRRQLIDGLKLSKGIKVFECKEPLANILTFRKENIEMTQAVNFLKMNKVYFSIANRFSALIDMDNKGIEWAIRFSPHYFNTEQELKRVLLLVDEM